MPSSNSPSGSPSSGTLWEVASLGGSEAKLLLVFLGSPAAMLGPRVSIAQLAAGAGLSWRSTQAALKRLEARGLLVRERHGKDGTSYRWPSPSPPLRTRPRRSRLSLPPSRGTRNR